MKAKIRYREPKRLLHPAAGFLQGYSHTLNPYVGCAYGCSYCYVRQMPVSLFHAEAWGDWVDVKRGAAALLKKEIANARKKGFVTLFMSSSTDPYQPVEHKERVTRSLLEAMTEEMPDFLFIQTRSPLIKRDIDLLQQLEGRVLVSITIETDDDDMRRTFTPKAPPIAARIKALEALKQAGIMTQAAVAPILPSSDAFPERLRGKVHRICIDDFYQGDGSGGKRTERLQIRNLYPAELAEKWLSRTAYQNVMARFERVFGKHAVFMSKAGFLPPKHLLTHGD